MCITGWWSGLQCMKCSRVLDNSWRFPWTFVESFMSEWLCVGRWPSSSWMRTSDCGTSKKNWFPVWTRRWGELGCCPHSGKADVFCFWGGELVWHFWLSELKLKMQLICKHISNALITYKLRMTSFQSSFNFQQWALGSKSSLSWTSIDKLFDILEVYMSSSNKMSCSSQSVIFPSSPNNVSLAQVSVLSSPASISKIIVNTKCFISRFG